MVSRPRGMYQKRHTPVGVRVWWARVIGSLSETPKATSKLLQLAHGACRACRLWQIARALLMAG